MVTNRPGRQRTAASLELEALGDEGLEVLVDSHENFLDLLPLSQMEAVVGKGLHKVDINVLSLDLVQREHLGEMGRSVSIALEKVDHASGPGGVASEVFDVPTRYAE